MNLTPVLNFFGIKAHPFRKMSFNELSELYVSMMLRSLAMSMSGIFIPIFLHQLGYEIWQILSFYFVCFAVNYIFAIPAAGVVAKIGPKHTILISYLLQIFTMIGLVYLKDMPSLFIPSAIVLGLANIAFFTAFHTDFSKVKHSKTGGSELGIAYLGERFGAVLGPIIGGLVAFIFDPKFIFIAAIIVLISAVIPLFMTKEPTRLNQKLEYRDFSMSKIKPDVISYSFFTVEVAVSMIIWPLFLGVFVFQGNPYIQLGSIMSVSIIIALVVARIYGKLIDNRQGRTLLRFSAVSNAALHLFRVSTNGFVPALGVNLVNETITPGYRMPTFKGMYDAADSFPGHRIVYISIIELFGSMSRMLFFGLSALAAYNFHAGKAFFGVLFVVGAISSLLMMLEKYPALDPKKGFRLWKK
jgi:MFS family permease